MEETKTTTKTTLKRKLWLDDERPEPDDGWVRAKTAGFAVMLLATTEFDEISLDHDLGSETSGTGYDVACWLEEEAMSNPQFLIPIVHIHTANAGARKKMQLAARNIEQFRQQRTGGS